MDVIRELRRTIFLFLIIGLIIVSAQLRASILNRTRSENSNHGIQTFSKPTKQIKTSNNVPKVKIEPVASDYTLPEVTDGLVPVLNSIPTTQKVVFLGIDDGVARTAEALDILTSQHVQASLFLNDVNVEPNVEYFKSMQSSGSIVENHTVDHNDLTLMDYASQKNEICNNADRFETLFNHRPTLLRPPYGNYDQNTRRAAADCGMRALINWSAKANGGSMQYQNDRTSLMPGDIVLMHFRPEFAQDFKAYEDAINAAGLQTASLEEWLK